MAELPTQRDFEDYSAWSGRDVLTSDGDRLGAVEVIFLDEATDLPEWVLVRLDEADGSAFVPLAGANVEEQAIRVEPDRERIAAAPRIDADETLTVAEERRLYEHYGLAYSQEESSTVLPEGATESAAATEPTEERPRLRRYASAPAPPAGGDAGTPEPSAGAEAAAAGAGAGEGAGAAAAAAAAAAGAAASSEPSTADSAAGAGGGATEPSTADTGAGATPTPSPAPSDGPTTKGTGVTEPAPTPLPPPAPTPIPPEGGFQREAEGADTASGPLAVLKRRPAIPIALAGAIAGLIAVLALRRRR